MPKEEMSPEMEEAIICTFYHHPMGGKAILELLLRREFSTPPSTPTENQERMAHDIVEEILRLHYTILDESMKEVTGKGLEDNPYI